MKRRKRRIKKWKGGKALCLGMVLVVAWWCAAVPSADEAKVRCSGTLEIHKHGAPGCVGLAECNAEAGRGRQDKRKGWYSQVGW